ncbi:transporter substrate-binding domain-containing protein [Pseudoprimorskyibacter insulae]|uniref:Glutamine-binding periplasmic protein n=1 Tax=Pseudoprimorskyibacter insulae TaxID=1695997 RepID=A0A2R8AUU1_9RHOB|nr:transporter substrate-binding domain-containing protein [Pseudoprimorskyibacter insulae]SPF79639.1 Glutamine-binding periplasmic protein [Pseudoprimorskyibacter insulae]
MRLLQVLTVLIGMLVANSAASQDAPLVFATVDRPPFAFADNRGVTGFSIDLMEAIGNEIGRDIEFQMQDTFPAMLSAVQDQTVDGAVANISITADREVRMDFTQPIFESGLQILVAGKAEQASILSLILTREIVVSLLLAFVLLLGGGMLMWVFERKRQPYFDRPLDEAMFPSFWWALNLVVNGGFEERMPRSPLGRVFAVMLVVSSLFIVSIFVAQITAALTVGALNNQIDSINDLDRKEVVTTEGSTASAFLSARDVRHRTVGTFNDMIQAMEQGDADAVFFDGPLLQYYLMTHPGLEAYLVDRVFKAENYGIALPSGSPMREPMNQALLKIQESGLYGAIYTKWFGNPQ